MNMMLNDKNEEVVQVGNPISEMRTRAAYPLLIETIISYLQNAPDDLEIDTIDITNAAVIAFNDYFKKDGKL